jgi:hypothetical protein
MTNHSGKKNVTFRASQYIHLEEKKMNWTYLKYLLLANWRTTQTKRKCRRVENYYRHTAYCQSQADANFYGGGGGAFIDG